MRSPRHFHSTTRPPIEGDEEYICCAGTALTWRCADCGKASEGFAVDASSRTRGRMRVAVIREIVSRDDDRGIGLADPELSIHITDRIIISIE